LIPSTRNVSREFHYIAARQKSLKNIILRGTDPLLRNDIKTGGYTRAVSEQQLGKYVPVARQQIINNATAGQEQWKSNVFYAVRAEI
jgi:hypothetical protein